MAITILSPDNSFYQFNAPEIIQGCGFEPFGICIPVFEASDVAFQFILKADTKAEADALCDLTNSKLRIGLSPKAGEPGFILEFTALKTERYRVSDTEVLYNWSNGVPGFDTEVPLGGSFVISILLNNTQWFYSNTLERIADDCFTTMTEYGNDEDAFGFNYCNGTSIDNSDADATCDPMFFQFTNLSSYTINYIASLAAKFGVVPNVSVWIVDETGGLINAGIVAKFDAIPVTRIDFDFGGNTSGIIKLSRG